MRAKIRVCIFVEHRIEMMTKMKLKYRIREDVMTDGTLRFRAEVGTDFMGSCAWTPISASDLKTFDQAKEAIEKDKSLVRVADTKYHDVE